MHFYLANTAGRRKNTFYLLHDGWNDWFEFLTLYVLIYIDEEKERHVIGSVKIGQFDWKDKQTEPNLPEDFGQLEDNFFSIGQDPTYYERLNKLGSEIRRTVLTSMNDLALDEEKLRLALRERVTTRSLFRSINVNVVRTQFRRLANGGARLTEFDFSFTSATNKNNKNPPTLTFLVEPESNPPSNIHVLIGRNGVGKTHLLGNMTKSFLAWEAEKSPFGYFEFRSRDENNETFVNLVSVSWSAFDDAEVFEEIKDRVRRRQFSYIGLRRRSRIKGDEKLKTKTPDELQKEFVKSVNECSVNFKLDTWKRALEILETDPIFKNEEIAKIANRSDEAALDDDAKNAFKALSSGHKIVLLTITRLVETVDERTLILIDEPESHLHPPLLSAFIRALSNLLLEKNGVAIIATHSPVVLQEVPKKCVWKLSRVGFLSKAERFDLETFGENVGLLTREVFGLEVTNSGFHNMIKKEVDEGKDYDDILELFDEEIGMEAKAILRMLIYARDQEGGKNVES